MGHVQRYSGKEIAGYAEEVASMGDDQGVSGHLRNFGLRIMMYSDEVAGETVMEWTCLYGVQ